MIEFRTTTIEDAEEACRSAKSAYASEGGLIINVIKNLKSGPSFTLYDKNGHIGCIVGGCQVWNGVARIWAVTTPYLDEHPVGYTRTVLALLKWGVRHYNIHRAEMTVKADYQAGIRWAKLMGFEAEGLLRNYGCDKSDYLLFGRLT